MKLLFTCLTLLIAFGQSIAQTEFKRDSIHQFSWNTSTDEWRFNTREFFTYDNGGDKETNLLRLNLSGASWDNFYQFNKSYDSNNNLEENIRQDWNGSSWDDKVKYNYEYDDLENEISYLYSIFTGGIWQEYQREQKTYDGSNISLKVEEQYSFISMSFVPQDRYLYTYTGNRLEEELKQFYFDDISVWANEQKLVYTYNSATGGLLIDLSRYGYNANDAEFSTTPTPKVTFTYNEDGLIEERLTQQISSATDSFQNTERIIYTYVDGNLTELLLQNWDSTAEVWINNNRQLRSFDADNNEVELIYEAWEKNSNVWNGYLRILSYWSLIETLSLADDYNVNNDIQLYPNPSLDYITINATIKIDGSKLYNTAGQCVKIFKDSENKKAIIKIIKK